MRGSESGAPGGRASRWPRLTAGIVLVAVIVAGAALSIFDRSLAAAPPRARFLDGAWTAAWQADYEQGLPVRDGAVSLWTLLRYGLFGEARSEALVGSDGWLFSTEELDPPADLSVPIAEAVERIVSTRDTLSAKGIGLVVALVPTKVTVEQDHLGRYKIPSDIATRYGAARRALLARGITTPDLLQPLRDGAVSEDMYLRTDTHWTPQGARRAADTLAAVIIPLLDQLGSSRTAFETETDGSPSVAGDLLKFLPLGHWQHRGPAPDIVMERNTTAREDGGSPEDLFGELDIPIALVGTSYSVNSVSGFEGALKDAVDADMLNVAMEGKGPFAPMAAYLESDAIDDPRPDVVVWEIPERYLIPDSR